MKKSLIHSLAALPVLLCGCVSRSASTGRVRVAGIPIPFTGGSAEQSSAEAAMIDQLAPFQWVALALIVGGAAAVWFGGTRSGVGVFSILLGVGLSLFALIAPKVAGWIALISIVAFAALVIYFVVCLFTERKFRLPFINPPY